MNSGWYRTPDVRLIAATAVTGVMAGVAGIALTLLLHAVQDAAFGYTEEAFLTGVEQASAARRVIAMAIGGAVVGTGWWMLRRYSWRFPAEKPDVPLILAQSTHRQGFPTAKANAYSDNHESASSPYPVPRFARCAPPNRPAAGRCASPTAPRGAHRARS